MPQTCVDMRTHIVKQQVDPAGNVRVSADQYFAQQQQRNDETRTRRSRSLTTKCIHTSVPLAYIAAQQKNVSDIRGGSSSDSAPHLDNFSIPNFIQPTKYSKIKAQNVAGLFTRKKLDLQSHVGASENLIDPRVQSSKWFEQVVLLKGEMPERFVDTFDTTEPKPTFSNSDYTKETFRLLNQLSHVRFVTQKLSQDLQRRRRKRGDKSVDSTISLYPHL